jgi:hypothetical protein
VIELAATNATLEQVVGLLDATYLEVLGASPTLREPVSAAAILDVFTQDAMRPGEILLAVGLRAGDRNLQIALRAAGEVGAMIACRADDMTERNELLELSRSTGAVVLAVAPELSWDSLYNLVRTVISSINTTVVDVHSGMLGDLFTLANAAAATLEGPVIMDNDRMEVIAFSNLDDSIDDLRRRSILQRRPPQEFLDWCKASGILRRVRQSTEAVTVTPPDGDRRAVIAIRVGSDILGYMWVAEKQRPLDSRALKQLGEIARVAAVQILRTGTTEGMERRLRGDLLRSALEGRTDGAALAVRMGFRPDEAFVVGAFRCTQPAQFDLYEERGVCEMVVLKLEAARRSSAVTILGEYVYFVVGVNAPVGAKDIRVLLEEVLGSAERQLGVGLQAVLGGIVQSAHHLEPARHQIERLFRTVSRADSAQLVVFDDIRSRAVLEDLLDHMLSRPELIDGGVLAMARGDAAKGTDYLKSLAAVFDNGGDLTAAARDLYLHRNTLKYRLSRIRDLYGIDVTDPVERLITELQLHAVQRMEFDVAAEVGPNGQASPGTSSLWDKTAGPSSAHTGRVHP